MKEKRRHDSEALQQWLFDNFKLLNARGETRTVGEIFAETPLGVPPSGRGENVVRPNFFKPPIGAAGPLYP